MQNAAETNMLWIIGGVGSSIMYCCFFPFYDVVYAFIFQMR